MVARFYQLGFARRSRLGYHFGIQCLRLYKILIFGSAKFSRCRSYRYLLTRSRSQALPQPSVTFIMLNPAQADAEHNDQTISKCIGFATRFGYQTLHVINLYAYCTSYQEELYAATKPNGPSNNRWLKKVLSDSDKVICAWGKGAPKDRVKFVQRLCSTHDIEMQSLGLNKDGSPKHPARLGYDLTPTQFT